MSLDQNYNRCKRKCLNNYSENNVHFRNELNELFMRNIDYIDSRLRNGVKLKQFLSFMKYN